MCHYTDRTHFFRDDDGNRLVVITTMHTDRIFEATLIEGGPEGVEITGEGDTRMAAIADLYANIVETEEMAR